MTTIQTLAAELGFDNTYGLRAFADDLLDNLPDDRAEVPDSIEAILREAVGAHTPPIEDDLRLAAEQLATAREQESEARATLADAVQAAHESGMSLYRIGQVTGLARATVSKWAAGER